MRCGKFDYNERTGEFEIPDPRQGRFSPKRLASLWSSCKAISFAILSWVLRPWIWWWTNERKCWNNHQWSKCAFWLIAGFVLLKAYKFGLAFLFWGLGYAYVWIVYAIRFLRAVLVWCWDLICECCRCFCPLLQQSWNWFWTFGDDLLK